VRINKERPADPRRDLWAERHYLKIYLAARFSRLTEVDAHRGVLEAAGFEIVSRWHSEQKGQPTDGAMRNHSAEENAEFAERDLEDVRRADALVLFTESPESRWPRGARHVEYGAALAWGKKLILIGPRENVFHWLLPDSALFPTARALAESYSLGGTRWNS
jgi:nucleoside 2-deoxyribosyltransferase